MGSKMRLRQKTFYLFPSLFSWLKGKKGINEPEFGNGGLELRISDTEIEIFLSEDGMSLFVKLLETLRNNGIGSQIHLKDCEILTPASKNVTLILFK
jgi:hypothetical protein